MSGNSSKTPPSLSKAKNYQDWLKLIKIWRKFSDLPKEKQGPAIVLSLENEALDAVLELEEETISAENGVDTIIAKLDRIYKKDETLENYMALEAFETFKRTENMKISDYLNQFEKLFNKTKSYGTQMSENVLAYRLLKSANLPELHEQMVKGTITDLKYDLMKEQLKKMFGESLPSKEKVSIKTEDTFHTQHKQNLSEREIYESEYSEEDDYPQEMYFTNRHPKRFSKPSYPNPREYRKPPTNNQQYRPQASSNFKNSYRQYQPTQTNRKGKNPKDKDGNYTRCTICESINHWTPNCPDNQDHNNTFYNEIVLYQSDYDHPSKFLSLVDESRNAAVLDSGASKTVCGESWFNTFQDSLNDNDRNKIQFQDSSSQYKFGDGAQVTAITSATIPIVIGTTKAQMNVDIVPSNIPLLLSRDSMKRANMQLNFENDTITAFGESINLIITKSGHYAVPITNQKRLLNDVNLLNENNITLTVVHDKTNRDIAIKLHRQFAHPTSNKLIKLIDSAGDKWKNNMELKNEIVKVTNTCNTCKIFKKPPPRPVVGLPMASKFLECIAMDLKFYKKHILLHLIDHATRLSASAVIPSKKPEIIIKKIFQIWISVYGVPEKFLSDNGGEFANDDFANMCEAMNINFKLTGAESPWSNGLVERHNLILADMLDRILEESTDNIEIAVAWAINAKNSLTNIHGFSPYQLAIGQNPKLPNANTNDAPALTHESTTKILEDNLSYLHKAREAFIQSENSERIKRALSHNIRTYSDHKYLTGDSVYFKRANEKRWRGPGKVLGQDGQQILIKYGANYVRVHPCRVTPDRNPQITEQAKMFEKDNIFDYKCSPVSNKSDQISESESELEYPSTSNNIPNTDNSIPNTEQNTTNQNSRRNIAASTPDLSQHLPPTSLKNLRVNDTVKFRYNNNDENWHTATLIKRGGKVTGKYANTWNVKFPDNTIKAVDFEREIDSWKTEQVENPAINNDDNDLSDTIQNLSRLSISEPNLSSSQPDEILINEHCQLSKDQEIHEAKERELNSWKEQYVYTEVPDNGQSTMSVRWVLKPKIINGRPSIKARLCARGFEETETFRTDSPTCSREGIRLVLMSIASKRWKLNSIDVKTAFLQGKPIERDIYLRPPKEAKTDKLWHLRKCVYGLGDAPRFWYLRVKEEFIKLNGKICPADQGIFVWYKNDQLIGIIACFVDDMIWGGTEYFFETVIKNFKSTFQIGAEHFAAFTYLGLNIKQKDDFSIDVDQTSYINSISPILLDKDRAKNTAAPITDQERSQFRQLIGQLNWVTNMTRPEFCFEVCYASTIVNSATISDIIKLNKVLKKMKSEVSHIKFPSLNTQSLNIKTYTDASFNNLPKGGSQGGQIVFIEDNKNNICPVAWNSSKIKRVVRSTLAAETLALTDGCDLSFYVSQITNHIYRQNIKNIILTDNKSLKDTIQSSNLISDKRLRVDLSALCEMYDKNELEVKWIPTNAQVSNVLTKRGANRQDLVDILETGQLLNIL